MLVAVGDHRCLVEVFVVDDLGLIIEGLHDHLLPVRLQKHVLDKWLTEEVHIVPLEESVVEEKRGESEEGVADDSGDCRHENWVDEQRVDYSGVQEGASKAGALSQAEEDLLVIHWDNRVNFAIAGVVDEVELALGGYNWKGTLGCLKQDLLHRLCWCQLLRKHHF